MWGPGPPMPCDYGYMGMPPPPGGPPGMPGYGCAGKGDFGYGMMKGDFGPYGCKGPPPPPPGMDCAMGLWPPPMGGSHDDRGRGDPRDHRDDRRDSGSGASSGSLFVGGVSFRAEERDLRALFERAHIQAQNVTISTDRETGKSRGFAFVELADHRQVDHAIRTLNGADCCGRNITVQEQVQKAKGDGGKGERHPPHGGGGRDGPRDFGQDRGYSDRGGDVGSRLFVGGVNFSATDEDLRSKFAEVGEVVSAKIVLDRDTGKSKGFAFVEFADARDAQVALRKLQGVEICGRPIRLNLPTEKGGGKGGKEGGKDGGKDGGFGGFGGGASRKPAYSGMSTDRRKELFDSSSPSRSRSRGRNRHRRSRSRKEVQRRSPSDSLRRGLIVDGGEVISDFGRREGKRSGWDRPDESEL